VKPKPVLAPQTSSRRRPICRPARTRSAVRSSASGFLLIAAGRVLFKRGELDAFATAESGDPS